jgi:hypothetical protein
MGPRIAILIGLLLRPLAAVREAALEAHELDVVAVDHHSLRHPARGADRRPVVALLLVVAPACHDSRLARAAAEE